MANDFWDPLRNAWTRRRFLRQGALLGAAAMALPRLSGLRMGPARPEHAAAVTFDELSAAFSHPPDDCRILMRWWWFGPDVYNPELGRELEILQLAGIGGVEVNAVYPVILPDPAAGLVPETYNGPAFLQSIRYAAETARRLGLRFDLTIGSGWPYGGPWIPQPLAAGKLEVARIPVAAGASAADWKPAHPGDQAFYAVLVPAGEPEHAAAGREVAQIAGGRITFPAASGARTLLVFSAGHTRQLVKRAAVGAEGYVLDHYNRAALERHLSVLGDDLLRAAGAGNVTTAFCDSLEVFEANWTPALLDEFKRRRGYGLEPHLPDLVGENGDVTTAVRHDFGQTLTELLEDNFLEPFQQWCHRRGVKARVQAYGTPPASVSSYRFVDFPEGEGRPWNQLSMNRWASSASHHYGNPITSAETWTWIHSPVFRAVPLDLKAGADQRFLAGVNLIVGHGFPYSPPAAGEPGWHFYAAGALNQHNPWWPVMPELTRYLQRMCYLLRQGEPANQVLLYAPNHDAWAAMPWQSPFLNEAIVKQVGDKLIPALLGAGYNFDLVDDGILAGAKSAEGKVHVRNHAYPIVILPAVEAMPLKTMELLAAFARNGGTLIADRRLPDKVPGLQSSPGDQQRLRDLVQTLVDEESLRLVADTAEIGNVLMRHMDPDVVFDPASGDMGFLRRRLPRGNIYFVANTGNRAWKGSVALRAQGDIEEWDGFDGHRRPVDVRERDEYIRFDLEIEPYGSRAYLIRQTKKHLHTGPRLGGWQPAGSVDLSHDWEVTFTGMNRTVKMAALTSWIEEPGLRFYSGEAVYRRTAEVTGKFLAASRVMLRLGEAKPQPIPTGSSMNDARNSARTWIESPVREAALVRINGHDAGGLWKPPYELDVRRWLQPGRNQIEVRVYNTAMNEMAAHPQPSQAALIAKFGRRFQNQDMNRIHPLPSGLLGPVTLAAED